MDLLAIYISCGEAVVKPRQMRRNTVSGQEQTLEQELPTSALPLLADLGH